MDFIQRDKECIVSTYDRYDLVVDRGSGSYLYDRDGKEYIDFVQGLGASILGHVHPVINKIVKEEIDKITQISGLYYSEARILLAERLCSLSGMGKVSFVNSGSEANEAAIKFVRKYGNEKRGGKNKILSMTEGFHGRTMGSVSLTWGERYKKGFNPLLPNTEFVKFNDVEDLKIKMDENVIAIIFEPIQGSANKIRPLEPEFIYELKDLQKRGVLLIADEVQCGMGRTGMFFGFEYFNLQPDVITMAKGLGNGYPIGVAMIKKEYDTFEISSHGTTFGGNAWVCKAALGVINTIFNEKLMDNAKEVGKYLCAELLKKSWVRKVNGMGLMRSAELIFDAENFVKLCRKEGLILNKFPGNSVKFSPAINITKKLVDDVLNIMGEVAKKCM